MPARHGDDPERELPAYLDPRGRPDDREDWDVAGRARYDADQRRDGYPPGPSGSPYGAPQQPYPPPGRPQPGAYPAPGARPPGQRRRKRRGGKIAISLIAALLVAILGFAVYLDLSLHREDILTDYEARPADTPGTTWLLVGTDSRDDLSEEERDELSTGYAEGKRTDTIMLVHIPDSDAAPTLVSLPRDTLVEIPGHGDQKLNAAFSIGGGALLAQTVEGLTGLRIDRYAEIGFGGFASVVDSVGGVELCLDEPIDDPMAGINLPAGCQTLDGPNALGYVRTRASALADLDRVARQRQFLSALLNKATSPGTLINPFRSIPLALHTTDALIVDDGAHLWHLAGLGLAMAADDLVTSTVPIGSTPTLDIGSVVIWDEEKAVAFFGALANDEAIPADLLSG